MKDYTEEKLVELPAIELFQSLGYEYQDCFHEPFGDRGTLGRETKSEVVLVSYLHLALQKLNLALPNEAIQQTINDLTREILLPKLIGWEIDMEKIKINVKEIES